MIFFSFSESEKMEIDFVSMKTRLLKTRRRVDCTINNKPKIELGSVFEIPTSNCTISQAILQHRKSLGTFRRETHVIVGKTSLLLSVLKDKNERKKRCTGHFPLYLF